MNENDIEFLKRRSAEGKIFDDRSKMAIEFLVKTILNISGAGIALFFVTLTKSIDPPLTATQRSFALWAVIALSANVFGVLLYAYMVYKRNSRRARILAVENPDQGLLEKYSTNAKRIHVLQIFSILFLAFSFVFGLALTSAFLVNRISF